MVDVAEAAVDFNRVNRSDVKLLQCIELAEATIYNYETKAALAKSANSAITVVHQIRLDDDRDKAAVVHVLASLLHDPAYKQLRTVEQLGYCVKLSKESILRVLHINLVVQSNKRDADYLESKINAFLGAYNVENPFSHASVEGNKQGIINAFRQASTNLQAEAQLHYSQILAEEYDFERRDQQIAAMEKVTAEQVNALAKEVLFVRPKRLNLRVYSHAAWADTAKRQESKALNKAWYEQLAQQHGTELNSVDIPVDDISGFQAAHRPYPRA